MEREEEYQRLAESFVNSVVEGQKYVHQALAQVRTEGLSKDLRIYLQETDEFLAETSKAIRNILAVPPDDLGIVFSMAAQRLKNKIESLPEDIKRHYLGLLHYECGDCHTEFMLPQEDFDKGVCPSCGREWTREELAKLKVK